MCMCHCCKAIHTYVMSRRSLVYTNVLQYDALFKKKFVLYLSVYCLFSVCVSVVCTEWADDNYLKSIKRQATGILLRAKRQQLSGSSGDGNRQQLTNSFLSTTLQTSVATSRVNTEETMSRSCEVDDTAPQASITAVQPVVAVTVTVFATAPCTESTELTNGEHTSPVTAVTTNVDSVDNLIVSPNATAAVNTMAATTATAEAAVEIEVGPCAHSSGSFTNIIHS